MSMTLYLVKVPPAIAERIKAYPELLNQVWDEVEMTDGDLARLDPEHDRLMEDYLSLGRVVNEEPDRYPWMRRALHGMGEEIAFEYGYGPGFVVTPQQAAQIVAGLAEEGWWRSGDEIVTIDHAIAAFYATARRNAQTVIGGIG
jgi:hypothetical protein